MIRRRAFITPLDESRDGPGRTHSRRPPTGDEGPVGGFSLRRGREETPIEFHIPDWSDETFWVVVVLAGLLLLLLHFLPTFIAFSRRHPNKASIAVVNMLLGWTLIGYTVALAWSLMAFEDPRKRTASVSFLIDDRLWPN